MFLCSKLVVLIASIDDKSRDFYNIKQLNIKQLNIKQLNIKQLNSMFMLCYAEERYGFKIE